MWPKEAELNDRRDCLKTSTRLSSDDDELTPPAEKPVNSARTLLKSEQYASEKIALNALSAAVLDSTWQ